MKVSWHVYTCLIRNWTITIRKLLSNQIRFSTRIRWYADSLSRNQAYALCRHIRLLFGKRLDTILLRHRFRQYPDSPPTRCRIRSGFIGFFFHSGERIEKTTGLAAEFAGCMWTEGVSGKKTVSDSKIFGYVWTSPQVYEMAHRQ